MMLTYRSVDRVRHSFSPDCFRVHVVDERLAFSDPFLGLRVDRAFYKLLQALRMNYHVRLEQH